ncbi:hypothetical protein B0H14DRAFT_3139948 [Mycena olivaceomarginata]|nr:hypothetical protein B0H14DRAFT_3139948 [Mycena olivaceomarginata]
MVSYLLSVSGFILSTAADQSIVVLIFKAPSDIVSATLGQQHTIFLYSWGTVSRLGSNKKPQLDGIDAAGTYTTGDGDAWELLTAGNNASGQLDRDGGELLRASAFCSHLRRFSYFLPSSTTEVWDWGWNEHGNLGVGTTEDVRIPVKIWPREAREATSGRVGI